MGSKTWILAGALGLVGGFAVRGLCESPIRSHAAPAATVAIADLRERDRLATLSGDPKALSDLWTEDAVRMEPGSPAEVGRTAIVAEDTHDAQTRPKGGGFVRYQPDIRGVSVHGDWAVEWGYFDGAWRRSARSESVPVRGKLLRVMHRDGDGKWRFSRVMWNAAS